MSFRNICNALSRVGIVGTVLIVSTEKHIWAEAKDTEACIKRILIRLPPLVYEKREESDRTVAKCSETWSTYTFNLGTYLCLFGNYVNSVYHYATRNVEIAADYLKTLTVDSDEN